jgi:ABC-type sugar transport system substrate-binding protein
MTKLSRSAALVALAFAMAAATPSRADDVTTYETTLKDAVFTVAEIKVPAGKPFIIKMTNANAAPAELEAKELDIEKVAAGNSTIVVRVKAMEPGKYLFVDEYQEDIAKGYVIVE